MADIMSVIRNQVMWFASFPIQHRTKQPNTRLPPIREVVPEGSLGSIQAVEIPPSKIAKHEHQTEDVSGPSTPIQPSPEPEPKNDVSPSPPSPVPDPNVVEIVEELPAALDCEVVKEQFYLEEDEDYSKFSKSDFVFFPFEAITTELDRARLRGWEVFGAAHGSFRGREYLVLVESLALANVRTLKRKYYNNHTHYCCKCQSFFSNFTQFFLHCDD